MTLCTARTLGVMALFLLAVGCVERGYEQIRGNTMGTYFAVVHDGCAIDKNAVSRRLVELNNSLSTYQADSLISTFNQSDAGLELALNADLLVPLEAARHVFSASHGAFDPTVGPLVDLWGFGPTGVRQGPTDEEVAQVQNWIGFEKIDFDRRRLIKSVSGLQLDLSAIAKGYAVDQLSAMASAEGCSNYMIDIGGEIVVRGVNAAGQAWRVGIEKPDPQDSGSVQLVLTLSDKAVATSGDYRNFRMIEGQRVDHVMDPRSGKPATNNVVSATVIDQSAMFADAWATAAMVLGVEAALALAETEGFALLLMSREASDSGVRIHYNEAMTAFARNLDSS
jgi:thiamine biosynthesis lipoprotein